MRPQSMPEPAKITNLFGPFQTTPSVDTRVVLYNLKFRCENLIRTLRILNPTRKSKLFCQRLYESLFQLISDLHHFYDCDLFMFINVCFLFSKKLSRRSLLRDCRPAKHIITDFDQKRKLSRYSRFNELEAKSRENGPTSQSSPFSKEKSVQPSGRLLHSKKPFF